MQRVSVEVELTWKSEAYPAMSDIVDALNIDAFIRNVPDCMLGEIVRVEKLEVTEEDDESWKQ